MENLSNKNEKRKMKKKTKIIIIAILFVAVLVVLLALYFVNKPSKNKPKEEVSKTTITKVDTKNWFTPKGNVTTINFYSSGYYDAAVKKGEDESNYVLEDSIYKLKNTYKCTTADCVYFTPLDGFSVIYDDAKYYYYDYENNKAKKISLEGTFKDINILSYEGKIYGLVLTNDSNLKAFYSYDDEKVTIDYKYDYMETYNRFLLSKGMLIVGYTNEFSNYETYIVDYKTGDIKFDAEGANIGTVNNDNTVYYYKNYCETDCMEAKIYNENFKLLFDGEKYSLFDVSTSGNIAVASDGATSYSIYNKNGTLIKKSKEYKTVNLIVNGYIAVVDKDNYLKLIDFDGNVVAKFLELTDDYIFHSMISGWYTENDKNGIYLVVENKTIEYGTKGSGLEYYYIPTTKEKGVIETEGVGGYAKPVLYLYPKENNTNITVSFEKPQLLTTTYPKYLKNWKVKANSNGDLFDMDGKYYYGLYWEEQGFTKVDFTTGFYVTEDDAIAFLEEKLTKIGLNDKERNEFIMYWLPILEKNKKSLVYFELTKQREAFNKLIINPTPDSLLRVAIHVKKVDKKVNIKEEVLPLFERTGFTAVEWGGVIH